MQGILLLCTFLVQVAEYLYHGQKMIHLFPRACERKKCCLHKLFSMLSCKRSILLLTCLSRNIHTSGQYLNWDSKYALISTSFSRRLKTTHFQHIKIKFQASVHVYSKKLIIIWFPYSVILHICSKTFMLITRKLWGGIYQYLTSQSYFTTNTQVM